MFGRAEHIVVRPIKLVQLCNASLSAFRYTSCSVPGVRDREWQHEQRIFNTASITDQTLMRKCELYVIYIKEIFVCAAQIQFVWIVMAAAVNVHWNKNMALFVSFDPAIRRRVEYLDLMQSTYWRDSYEIILCRQSDRVRPRRAVKLLNLQPNRETCWKISL